MGGASAPFILKGEILTDAHGDYETRSVLDLTAVGLSNYLAHPTTDAWCFSYRLGKEPVRRWNEGDPLDILFPLFTHIANGGIFKGHNVLFEIGVTNEIMHKRHGWPMKLDVRQCRCTMAMGYAMALPGSLEKMAPALGISEAKDAAGKRLMLQMCRPREIKPDGMIVWWDDAEKRERLGQYCDQDVITESAADERLMPLSEAEQTLWELDAIINLRGIYVDQRAIKNAIELVQAEQDRLNLAMRKVTGNFVGFCTEVKRLTDWVRFQGVPVDGLAKADVLDALADQSIPGPVREALLLRQEAGKSSTAKLNAMLQRVSADGRLRGTLQYHGASTGRWAGRGVQFHNLPRPKLPADEIERAIALVSASSDLNATARHLDIAYGSPLDIISWSLRGMIIAGPGSHIYCADFANIEGRGAAWLAGEEWKLEAFREYDAGRGPDIYFVSAGRIYQRPVESFSKQDVERQTGKVGELSLIYQGGLGAFRRMEKSLGLRLNLTDEQIQAAKEGWRNGHPKIVQYWYDLEDACKAAVSNPGSIQIAGAKGRQVKFRVKGSFLWCLLPSGRVLTYPYPKLKAIETPWGEMKEQVHYMTVDGISNKWVETHTYGGKLTENITQAVCRDLLVAGIWACERAGYPVVLHVHDEIVSEVKEGFGDLKEFEALCSTTPVWAEGLPVVAKGYSAKRYRKE